MIKIFKGSIPIRFLCRYFAVSPSSYYYWLSNHQQPSLKRQDIICSEINKIFIDSKKTYGSPRVRMELVNKNIRVSENTVAKYMAKMELDARLKKKFRVKTTDSNHSYSIAPRLFKTEEHTTLPKSPGKF